MWIHHSNGMKQESGAILVVSLIFLLVLTVLGVVGMQVTSLEERMASNLRDRNLAFQAAESALWEGENRIKSSIAYNAPPVGTTYSDDTFYNNTYSGSNLSNVAAAPTFAIEALPGGNGYYRITAKGTGGTSDAVVILQSIYKYP